MSRERLRLNGLPRSKNAQALPTAGQAGVPVPLGLRRCGIAADAHCEPIGHNRFIPAAVARGSYFW